MNKKGAIEFSMTTIIVIIIGITILALAIPWVSRMMRQTVQLTDTAFEQAKQQLAGELSAANNVIVVPSSLSLGANDQVTVSVGCYNTAVPEGDDSGSKPATLSGATGTNIVVSQSEGGTDIPSGGKYYWGLVVKAKSSVGSETDPEVLSLVVDCSGASETRPLTITFR